MTSILLAENMLDDGSIRDEKLLSDAAATVFLGKLFFSYIRPIVHNNILLPTGGSDTVSFSSQFLNLEPR